MTSSLVGSEMCIRDRSSAVQSGLAALNSMAEVAQKSTHPANNDCRVWSKGCLLYTSDAADDM
eukprot:10403578-Prorocentrum_lima.AAC.1